jgi:hypothetical protein
MLHFLEVVALITGVFVIAIETVIIILLNKHIKALDGHLDENRKLMIKFEKDIQNHLDHLNNHSHTIEKKLEDICGMDFTQHERGSIKNENNLEIKEVFNTK